MGILVEVNGNERTLIMVEGTTDKKEAQKAAYFALFGKPTHPEEEPTAETIDEYTHVPVVHEVKIG